MACRDDCEDCKVARTVEVGPEDIVRLVIKDIHGFRQNLFLFSATKSGGIKLLDSFSTHTKIRLKARAQASKNKADHGAYFAEVMSVTVPAAFRHYKPVAIGDRFKWMRFGDDLLFRVQPEVYPRPQPTGIPLCDGCGGFIYRLTERLQKNPQFVGNDKFCSKACRVSYYKGLAQIRAVPSTPL